MSTRHGEIRIIGLSHHTAGLDIRERVAIPPAEYGQRLKEVLAFPGVREGVMLSTCNRSELVAVVDPSMNGQDIVPFVTLLRDRVGDEVDSCLYRLSGPGAVRHLFQVTSSLDSLVVGEAQITGQVHEAFALAAEAGASGPILRRLFSRARSVAKRVRTETGIGQYHVSVASVAVELAGKIFSSLEGRSALVIGAGDTSVLTLTHMAEAGIRRAYVANRTEAKAIDVAASLGIVSVPLERRFELLGEVDIVISATAADHAVFTRRDVAEAMARRRHRPLFLIDLAVPRDIEPAVADLDGIFLFNVDDLDQVVSRNLEERKKEAEKGRVIVAGEVDRFLAWLEGQHAVPTVVALRERVEEIRRIEEEKLFQRTKNMPPEHRDAVRAYGAQLINKILHGPSVRLKNSADPRSAADMVAAIRELFDLDDENPDE